MLGCRDRLGGDRDCVGSGPGPCRVGGGTVPGGRWWRDGVAVLGGTVSVRPGTVTVWPGSVTVHVCAPPHTVRAAAAHNMHAARNTIFGTEILE